MNKKYFQENVLLAYFNARRYKRKTVNQLVFEKDFDKNCLYLADKIMSAKYKTGKSICFVNYKPVIREIFAGDFKDRVVHHLVFNYINNFFEDYFIYDSYSCRVGKGTKFGVERLQKFIRQSTKNYTEKTYVLQLDISGYFMSLNRKILFKNLKSFLEKRFLDEKFLRNMSEEKIFLNYSKFFPNKKKFSRENFLKNKDQRKKIFNLIIYLIKEIIFSDPTKNCIKKSRNFEYDLVPKTKSLFYAKRFCGMPIGNLTSQIFGNFYMDGLDKFIKNDLKIKYYGRYVDDFNLINNSKEKLLSCIPKIEKFLDENLNLKLNKKKTILQEYQKGFTFLGIHQKPYRSYIGNRTKGNFYEKIFLLNKDMEIFKDELQKFEWNRKVLKKCKFKNLFFSYSKNRLKAYGKNETKEDLETQEKNFFIDMKKFRIFLKNFESKINSYLGLIKFHKSYKLRKKMLSMIDKNRWKYFDLNEDLDKVVLKEGYKKIIKKI